MLHGRPGWLRQSRFLAVPFFVACFLVAASCSRQSGVAKEEREAAEDKLREIQKTLDALVAAYQAGTMDKANKLSMALGDLYEGQAEGVVAKVAASENRQLDPLLEATIPAKVRQNVSVEELQTLGKRAHKLLGEAFEKIEATE